MEVIKCPKCQITMREREQGDVIVDICPQCRGVWLDAGELEKLSVRESRYYDDDDDDDDDRRRQPAYRGDDDRARHDTVRATTNAVSTRAPASTPGPRRKASSPA